MYAIFIQKRKIGRRMKHGNSKNKKLVSRMTLEEKASLCSGLDFWHTKKEWNVSESLRKWSQTDLTDSASRTIKQTIWGINDSIQAVCFPAGCATASSFNRELVTKLGETLGEECQAENVSTILGPAMNIKRSPLCGRNFEYYSEDPLVSTEMAGALVHGVRANISEQVRSILWQITRNITA